MQNIYMYASVQTATTQPYTCRYLVEEIHVRFRVRCNILNDEPGYNYWSSPNHQTTLNRVNYRCLMKLFTTVPLKVRIL